MAGASGPSGFADVVTATGRQCPACERDGGRIFYEALALPTHQASLMPSREAALDCPKGDLKLAFCDGCGFIWNTAFRPELVTYSDAYEGTQACSPTFNRFHDRLARQLFERYDLAEKEVYEIGCGQGEFLALLAALGTRHAVGFDPVLREGEAPPGVTLVKDWYSPAYGDRRPDFVASKMVMEHIPDPARFLGMLRETIGDRTDAVTFAMMPEARRVLEVRAFWDIYYEHCAYYAPGSLARAFRHAGFDPFDLSTDFDDHYCLIAARPGDGTSAPLPGEEMPAEMAAVVDDFARDIADRRERWRGWLRHEQAAGRSVVLWGGASKAVAFLSALGIRDEIAFAVDINPRRHGTFVAGSGHRIDDPAVLREVHPAHVIIMSPVYADEIRADLAEMGLTPHVFSIEDTPEMPAGA